jgi:acyl-CoA reductase-like NAD-dependent aldehyde dehydrogenase
MRGMKRNERGRIIHRLGDLVLEHADELAALENYLEVKSVCVQL